MDNEKPVTATPPGLVFHYTNQAGLLGIIRDRKIWATDILYLNDTAEMRYCFSLLESQLRTIAESETPEYVHALDVIRGLSLDLGLQLWRTFVTCFAEDGDRLSQWRGYCPGESGFSLGFNLAKLEKQMREQQFRVAKCRYEASLQIAAIRCLLQSTLAQLHQYAASQGKDADLFWAAPIWLTAVFAFLEMATQFKDPKFFEEEEWRLISFQPPEGINVHYRPGTSMIIPYIEFDWSGDEGLVSLEKIWVGPTPFPAESRKSVESLLKFNQMEHVEVQCSSTPCRTR